MLEPSLLAELMKQRLPTPQHKLSYLLGATRDASVHRYGKSCEIIFWQKHVAWLEKIISPILLDIFEIEALPKPTKGGWRLKFKSKRIFETLVSEYDFPEDGKQVFWHTPKPVKEGALPLGAYICGFFDAEGHAQTIPPQINLYHSWNTADGCPPLEDNKSFLQQLGIRAGSVRIRKPTRFQNYPRYILSVSNAEGVCKFYGSVGSLHPSKGFALLYAAGFGQRTEAPIL
ncbi:TPA: hypothetical protein HA244_06570 [Candidatus Micrarchaeota archaeon]|nr:hypothetical protein [Candidatus Micrarchaeota archaeon]